MLALRVSVVIIMEFYMENSCEAKGVNLENVFLDKFQEESPDMYAKINDFKVMIRIAEALENRYSISFLLDLFFGFENSIINADAVMHEVKFLEGTEPESHTKEQTEFKRPPLKGLWHKHYMDGSISGLAQNVNNALKNYSIPYCEQRIIEAKKSGLEQYMTAEDIPHIVNDLVTGNLQRRREEKKTTGEWLIYAIHENTKYYLCLAKHSDGDDVIRKKINSSCIYEFPFLKEILPVQVENT
jgi:hypothetical protein